MHYFVKGRFCILTERGVKSYKDQFKRRSFYVPNLQYRPRALQHLHARNRNNQGHEEIYV